jgi:hypothetical protein
MTIGKFTPAFFVHLRTKNQLIILQSRAGAPAKICETLSFKRKVCSREAEKSVFELLSASFAESADCCKISVPFGSHGKPAKFDIFSADCCPLTILEKVCPMQNLILPESF